MMAKFDKNAKKYWRCLNFRPLDSTFGVLEFYNNVPLIMARITQWIKENDK